MLVGVFHTEERAKEHAARLKGVYEKAGPATWTVFLVEPVQDDEVLETVSDPYVEPPRAKPVDMTPSYGRRQKPQPLFGT